MPQRTGSRVRAGTLGRAFLAHRGRQDLPACLRRHDSQLRRGPGAAHLRRRRPDRSRHPAHAVRPVRARERDRVLHRVFRARPDHGRRRRLPRHHRLEAGRWHAAPFPRPDRDPGDRRLWPRLFLRHIGPHLHGRRQCHGAPRRPAAAGHGIRAIPPDRHLRRRLPDHRGCPRRRRLSDEFGRRALHGALCAVRQGPGPPATSSRAR